MESWYLEDCHNKQQVLVCELDYVGMKDTSSFWAFIHSSKARVARLPMAEFSATLMHLLGAEANDPSCVLH